MDAATDLFRRFKQIHERYPALKQQILDELWETFVVNTEFENSRTIGSFHKTEKEWQMLEANMTLKEIRVQDSIRSLEWLQEHGTCGDNLRQDLSTIEQAGNGAFATRNLAKDSIVAQMPLIHISNSSIFDMYHFTDLRSLQTEHKIMQRQLQVNYCLWHTTSTLLLCPYGPGTSLINHNQTLANVKLQWGDPKRGNHEPQLLERPIEHFAKDSTAKLAMELIATRDIEEGEEVFLDYGDEWEAAWQTHVCLWKPIQNADRYISAYQMNEDERLLTVFEQLHYPYPSNVNLYCDVNFFSRIDWVALENEGKVIFTTSNEKFLPCEVLRYREIKSSLRYTAVVTRSATDGEPERFEKLTDAPREAFLFRDRPYSSDMFQPNAFRHPMMIPDEMFPEMWMNLPSLD